jgi:hypothetical protein
MLPKNALAFGEDGEGFGMLVRLLKSDCQNEANHRQVVGENPEVPQFGLCGIQGAESIVVPAENPKRIP